MPAKEELIAKILEAEWKMFQNVPNIGGRAACQDDYRNFKITRTGQAMAWSETVLASYLEDLKEAEKSGRNLLTEKYGYMMKSTSPEEYAKIERFLPHPGEEAIALVEEIVGLVLTWEEELQHQYPYIAKRGRPLYTSEDSPTVTSIETYLWGELPTYSLKTLKLYRDNILKQKVENINGSAVTLEYMMKLYGFGSLAEANERLSRP